MQRIRNILSCLSREDLLYGFPHSASLQTLTDQQIEIIADACAPSRQALAELSGDLLIFRLARSLAEHCPFQTTDGKNTGLVNLRAFLFLTLYIVAKNGHILSGRCPYGGKRCKDGISCARAAVRYFSQRPVFKSLS